MRLILKIELKDHVARGDLQIPDQPKALVIFVHGSGSGRYSPRNKEVADYLFLQGVATFLCDLTNEEERMSGFFDLEILAERTLGITRDLQKNSLLAELPIFYFGGSSGAAVAIAAASHGELGIKGIVSRGGRIDYARDYLGKITCPILLIVGGKDREVLKINEVCFHSISAPKSMEVIEGAGHLFEEPEMIKKVGEETWTWMNYIIHPPQYTYLF